MKEEVSSPLNKLYTMDGLHAILNAKYYQFIDIPFLFLCRHVDKNAGRVEDAEVKKVNTMYSKLLLELHHSSLEGNKDFKPLMFPLKKKVRKLKTYWFICLRTIVNWDCV